MSDTTQPACVCCVELVKNADIVTASKAHNWRFFTLTFKPVVGYKLTWSWGKAWANLLQLRPPCYISSPFDINLSDLSHSFNTLAPPPRNSMSHRNLFFLRDTNMRSVVCWLSRHHWGRITDPRQGRQVMRFARGCQQFSISTFWEGRDQPTCFVRI